MSAWLGNDVDITTMPDELIALLQETGGGEIFESESILGPSSQLDDEDGIAQVNVALRRKGMPNRLVVFHQGTFLCAVDVVAGDYVELDQSDFHVLRRFGSLDEWYVETIRAEFAERYGLARFS